MGLFENSTNKQDDVIDIHGDGVITNYSYWDCCCDDNYIKPVSQIKCDVCGYVIDDCPSSREDEVQEVIYGV